MKLIIFASLFLATFAFATEADFEIFSDDEFVSSGSSPQTLESARENAALNAMSACSKVDIHYLPERVSPFKDSSYARGFCNPYHQPNCDGGVSYTYISSAKFKCIDGGGW